MSGELSLLPPPLWGRVGEGGGAHGKRRCVNLATPTPSPSPQGGGECTEYAASLRFKHKQTCSDNSALLRADATRIPADVTRAKLFRDGPPASPISASVGGRSPPPHPIAPPAGAAPARGA